MARPKKRKLTWLLRWWVGEWGGYFMLESDLMAQQAGCPCTFAHSDVIRNKRNFEEERQRTLWQRERTAKYPLPFRGRCVVGEGDYLSRAGIE